jgi:molybdate transport system ATP-binding protein
LLDEPLSALDERLKQQILPFLKRVKDETRIPMLYVSHVRAEVDYLADRVLLMDQGRLQAAL